MRATCGVVSARTPRERPESWSTSLKSLISEPLPVPERQKFVRALSQIAQAAEMLGTDSGKPRRNLRRRKL